MDLKIEPKAVFDAYSTHIILIRDKRKAGDAFLRLRVFCT